MNIRVEKSTSHASSLTAPFADRQLVEELTAYGLISSKARGHALDMLYPSKNWGLWISRLLTVVGTSLILAGIMYFFAFNWAKISTIIKLGSIQLAILGCLAGALYYGIRARLSGKILLLSASILVGVFFAVFGQIYQTGADAYTLFMMWSLVILPWVIISDFAAHWIVWLLISNTFLLLWWDQSILPERNTESFIFSILVLFNGTFLAARELFLSKGVFWLKEGWTRVVLVISVLTFASFPTLEFIVRPSGASYSIVLGAALSVALHVGLYLNYRFKQPDMWVLAALVLSVCVSLEVAAFKVVHEMMPRSSPLNLLFVGIFTVGLFSLAIVKLRLIAKTLEVPHV